MCLNHSIYRTVKPLLTKDEFAITEQVAKNFGAPGGVGEKLQLMLEEKGAYEQNWVCYHIHANARSD